MHWAGIPPMEYWRRRLSPPPPPRMQTQATAASRGGFPRNGAPEFTDNGPGISFSGRYSTDTPGPAPGSAGVLPSRLPCGASKGAIMGPQ